MKGHRKSIKPIFFLILLGSAVVILFFYKSILISAGEFLAPEEAGNADVVILEGSEVIRGKGVEIGMSLLSSKKAHRLVIVYHNSEKEPIFDRPLNYDIFLTKKIEDCGLKKDQVQVIRVPRNHPITLTEAQIVLSHLSRERVKSAILLAEGFHTRRSYWAYKRIGLPLGIKIIPYSYFTVYQSKNWWQETDGVVAFMTESLKFFYYLVRGYIPVKSLLVT